jgi:exosortase
MTPTQPAARSGSYLPYFLLFFPLVCLVWAFWPTLIDLIHVWSSDPQYSHGFLVPVFAAFLLWMRRDMLKQGEVRPSWWGLPILAFGIGLHLYGSYYYYIWLDTVAIVPCVAGLWITAGWTTAWRWGWPAIAFLMFMIPLPYRYAVEMSGPLQRIATLSSTFVMQVIGLPALSDGNLISVDDVTINVAEACSGLRMLVVFVALAAAVAIVSRRPLLDKIIVLVSAVPIAIVSNILRVTVTGVLHHTTTNDLANTFFHDVAGWLMMPLALGLLWLELKILSALFIARPAPPPVRVTREPVVRRPTRQRYTKPAAGKDRPDCPDRPVESAEPVSVKPGAESQVNA